MNTYTLKNNTYSEAGFTRTIEAASMRHAVERWKDWVFASEYPVNPGTDITVFGTVTDAYGDVYRCSVSFTV